MILNTEEQEFFDTICQWAKQKVLPHVNAMDHEGIIPPWLQEELFNMGLMSIEVPTEFGGTGGTFFQSILAIQAISQVDPSISVFVDVQNTLFLNAVLRFAEKDLKTRVLKEIQNKSVGCYCLTEPDSGSDAFALKTVAQKIDSPDGQTIYEITGKKVFITNSGEARFFIVFANENPALGYKGITAFIIDKELHKGISIGKRENKLGIRASSTCEVILDKCQVSSAQILGISGQGYKVAIETLNEGRIGISAQMIGLAEGALSYAIKYVKERKQFGKYLNEFQSIQFILAELETEITAAKLLVYHAAKLKEAGTVFTKEAAMAKLFSSEVAEKVASQCLELLGGYGFIKEYPLEKFYRDSKIGKIYEGTSHMQKQTISKFLLSE